jgi:heterodisulfide reductase subunit B
VAVEFSYYPGCSAHSTGLEYDRSTRAVFDALDIELTELDDWNCCGASSAHSASRALALLLPARNLAIAQKAGRDVVVPCAACYSRHKSSEHVLRTDNERRAKIEGVVGFEFDGQVQMRPPLDVLYNDVGLETIGARVRRPLEGLKVVGYYGCLLVRPPEIAQFDRPDDPLIMDQVLTALGADVQRWSYATDCCGGALTLTKAEVATDLVSKLVARAREAGAEALATACPLCQTSLEMRQSGAGDKMPTFYFTELMALAWGLDETGAWWSKHLIDPRPLLRSVGLAKS